MTYRILIRRWGAWEQVGFDHPTIYSAYSEAETMLLGTAFIVVPG